MLRKLAFIAKIAAVTTLLAASSAVSQPSKLAALRSEAPKETRAICTFQQCRNICATVYEWGSDEWTECVIECVGTDAC